MAKLVTAAPSSVAKHTWLVRLSVILRAISIPGTFIVFLLYWGLVYTGGRVKAISCFTHGANFIIMLVETLLNKQKYYLLHGVYLLAYSVLYLVWSVIFHASELDRSCDCADDDDTDGGGCRERGDKKGADECSYIYSTLNWASESFTSTLIVACAIVFVICPLSVLGLYFLILCQRKNCASESANASDPVSLKRQDTLEVLQEDGYCAAFNNEFQLYRLSPDLDDWVGTFRSSRFSASISDGAYLRIRGGLFMFMLAVMAWSLIHYSFTGLWWIFLTNWTLVVEVVYLGVAFTLTLLAQREPEQPIP